MKVGLRVDVDTLRGTAGGVPRLLEALAEREILASFFFSVGPDNMGRHLLRLWRPAFAWKMLRTRAPSLYGWDILLRGTMGPGPQIAQRCGAVIRAAAEAGHEIGLHAWDHHAWQARLDRMPQDAIRRHLERGISALADLIGRPPTCSAAPGWICTPAALLAKSQLPFRYNSDCRGDRVFRPVVDGRPLGQVQVPVSLPTYDEVIGRGVAPADYNDHLLGELRDGALNVLTIHAEAEGMVCRDMFRAFLGAALGRGAQFVTLGSLADTLTAEPGTIEMREVPGRDGPVACLVS